MALRWGIASAGKISHDFVCALSTLPAEDHQVVAVAARSLESAEKFAKTHGIPKAYQGYESLAKDPNVDVVYIGTVNHVHLDVGILMLDNGKHILCEKPLCLNEKQARKLIEYAKSKQLFCMEAIWSRCFPAYEYILSRIKNGDLGEIKQVDVNFGFELQGIERLESKEMGGGTILDLGVYVIQMALFAFQDEPVEIKAEGKLNDQGVDLEVKAVLKFKNGGIANVRTSAFENLDLMATITGTKGSIKLPYFWCPTKITDIDGSEKEWPLPESKLNPGYVHSTGLRYEAEEARKCIKQGLLESPKISHRESLLIARIEDELRRQLGVKFEAD